MTQAKTLERSAVAPLQKSALHLVDEAEKFGKKQLDAGIDRAKEIQTQVVDTIKERPITSVAIGLVIGLVIGRLLRS